MKRGFTFLELLVVVGILTILIGLAFGLFNTANVGVDTHNIQVELQQEARRGLDAMQSDLYETSAPQITVDTAGNIITFKRPVVILGDTDIYDELGMIRWGAKVNDADPFGNTSYSIRYYRDGATRRLMREVILDAAPLSSRICANNLESIVFTPAPLPPAYPVFLNITVTCTKPVRTGSGSVLSSTLSSSVSFRN